MSNIKVVKRNGELEDFNIEKINRVLSWATSDLTNVSASDIAVHTKMQLKDNIETRDIHQVLIESAADLVTIDSPNYSIAASRLLNFQLRKDIWKGKNPPKLYDLIKKNVDRGVYTEDLLTKYSEEEIHKIDEFIDHDRDFLFDYGGLIQLMEKYLVQNRHTKEIYETPQFSFVLIGMSCFINDVDRLKWIKKFYDAASKFKINIPTPILAGARTNTKSYSSCCLIDVLDTKRSLMAAAQTSALVTCDKYGVGINLGNIRPINSSVRNGETLHAGVIPWLRIYQDVVGACQQGGARRGAGTVTFPIFHPEIMTILELKNNQGTHENRVPHLDYSISISNIFYKRLMYKEKISLFSSKDAPELYELFGTPEFDAAYLARERSDTPRIEVESLGEDFKACLFNKFFKERLETGRIYCLNIDQANNYSPWKSIVKMSNLCVTGDQRVVSDRGLLKVEELYKQGGDLRLFDNEKVVNSSPMTLIEKDADVYKITLSNGLTHKITDYHKVQIIKKDSRNRDVKVMVSCKDLKLGDKVTFQTNKGLFGNKSMEDEAFLLGLYQSDGTQHKDEIMLDVWENDFDLIEEIQSRFNHIFYKYGCNKISVSNQYGKFGTREIQPPVFFDCTKVGNFDKKRLKSNALKKSMNFEKGYIPSWIWESDENTHWQYLRGLLIADGSASISESNGNPLHISYVDTNKEFLKELQLLILNLGISVSLHKHQESGKRKLPDGKGGYSYYECKESWRLVIGNKNDGLVIEQNTGFLSRKGVNLENREYRDNTKKAYEITSISYEGKEDVYCVKVDSDEHLWVCNGIITSNCQEILHPLVAEKNSGDEEAEIGVCILAATNMLNIKSDSEHKKICELLVRLLDNIIDLQDYSVPACERFAKNKRSLGIGVTNLAAWLASKGFNHMSDESPQLFSDYMEKQQYYLMQASCKLAQERGAAPHWNQSKYCDAEFSPLDLYNKNVDDFLDPKPKMDWNSLMNEIKQYGMRHMTLSAIMPCQSSSIVQNSTNGIEPITSLITYKTSKTKTTPLLAPSISKWKNKYTIKNNITTNEPLIKLTAAGVKWLDMAASGNLYYNNDEIDLSELIQDHLLATRYGWKTFYYCNSKKRKDNLDNLEKGLEQEELNKKLNKIEDDTCAGGACSL